MLLDTDPVCSDVSFKSKLSGSDEESSVAGIDLDDLDDWDIYERDFDNKQFKKTQIGPEYQITDPLPSSNLTRSGSPSKHDQSVEHWNPDRLSQRELSKWTALLIQIYSRSLLREFKTIVAVSPV